ncbi:MAG: DUF2225 domain-containing protein [Deltaproteobacteria bacterium]|nr:DUF2225 domain-containing protein [Deltaproteobacteria bacterium]
MPATDATPAAGTSPFIVRSVACPLCGQEVTVRRLKTHLFIEQDRETDLRPRKYLRKKPGLTAYHPPLYFMWQCPLCRFTAGHPVFERPSQGTGLTVDGFQQAMQAVLYNSAKVQEALGHLRPVPQEVLDHVESMKLFYTAILIMQENAELEKRFALELGRYCLRLAWLYRDLREDPELRSRQAPGLAAVLKPLLPLWRKAPASEELALKFAAAYYQAALAHSAVAQDEAEAVKLSLLIARIHVKLEQFTEARTFWSKAMGIVKNLETKTQQAERHAFDLRRQLKFVSDKSRNYPELSAQVVEAEREALLLESRGKGLRLRVQEVSDLVADLAQEFTERQVAEARRQIKEAGLVDQAEIRAFLLKSAYGERVVATIAPEPKKKGLLGMFK